MCQIYIPKTAHEIMPIIIVISIIMGIISWAVLAYFIFLDHLVLQASYYSAYWFLKNISVLWWLHSHLCVLSHMITIYCVLQLIKQIMVHQSGFKHSWLVLYLSHWKSRWTNANCYHKWGLVSKMRTVCKQVAIIPFASRQRKGMNEDALDIMIVLAASRLTNFTDTENFLGMVFGIAVVRTTICS